MIGSWKPKNSVGFTLIKVRGDTLIYCHENDVLYIAGPHMKIHPDCTVGTGFIGHFIMENECPRFLVYDLCEYDCAKVESRYGKLRSLSTFLPGPICVVQWVGDLRCLNKEFFEKLPHGVEYVFSMDAGDPLCVYRKWDIEVCVDIPSILGQKHSDVPGCPRTAKRLWEEDSEVEGSETDQEVIESLLKKRRIPCTTEEQKTKDPKEPMEEDGQHTLR